MLPRWVDHFHFRLSRAHPALHIGFYLDVIGLLQFTLVTIERLDQTDSTADDIHLLFTSLNRIYLLALAAPSHSPRAVELLLSYPLVVLAQDNVDNNFFRCLVSKLCGILQWSEVEMEQEQALACLKLLALQRSEALDASFDHEEGL